MAANAQRTIFVSSPDVATGMLVPLTRESVSAGESVGALLAKLAREHAIAQLLYDERDLQPDRLWSDVEPSQPVLAVVAVRSRMDPMPWRDLADFVCRFSEPQRRLKATSDWNRGVVPYFKDITRAIDHTSEGAFAKLAPLDAELCAFMRGGAQPNPVTIIGDPRKGKSLTACNLMEMALFRGMNVLLAVAPNKIIVMREWYDKLLEHGLYAHFGVQGTHAQLRWSMTACRVFIYSLDVASDVPKASDFLRESMRKGIKVMHVIDEAQQVMKGAGRGRDVAICEGLANRLLYAAREMFVVLCSGTLTPAFLKDAGGVGVCDLDARMPRPIMPSESQCFINAKNIRMPWGSCAPGFKNADTQDLEFRAQAKRAIKAWLRKAHPSDGTQLIGPIAGVHAHGMLMFSTTSRITAAGGTAEWRRTLVKMAKNRRASCCIITIASAIGWNVTVVINGTVVPPSHDVGSKKMQAIVAHYMALGIDRFAYMGHGCLKASVTTAVLRGLKHFITMYAVVAMSKAMTVDRMAQLLGRFNTDMGDYRFRRRHNTWLLTNEGVVPMLQSYRDFEINVNTHWAPNLTLRQILALCFTDELSEATVGARKRKMEELAPAQRRAAKFARIYSVHPDLAVTSQSTGQRPMPTYGDAIWVIWSADHFPWYRGTVLDIRLITAAASDARVEYTVRLERDESGAPLHVQTVLPAHALDLDMNEWRYASP